MKIRIEETTYEGSAADILDRLRAVSFDADAFADTDGYIRYLQGNFIRMTDLPCELPEGNAEQRARAMLLRLSDVGALEVEDEG